MNYKHLLALIIFVVFSSCKNEQHLYKIEGKRIEINADIPSNDSIENFIAPYREHINKSLDSVLAYSVETYSKNDGDFNTALGNLMVDALMEQSKPIFKKRTGHEIDMALLNHGGIRSILPKGDVTIRTAYNLMPFENSSVVVALKGKYVNELVEYLSKAKRAHPIAGLQLTLTKDYDVQSATINGLPIDENRTYYVLTNDYLYNGGDHMNFFKKGDSLYVLDYKIRNALIDYFSKKDTLRPTIDDRFIQIN